MDKLKYQYIIVPHTQRDSTKVTLNNKKTISILHDPKGKGYNSPNEDPFVRYKSAWFYSFCHTNITLSSDVRKRIKEKNEKIKFVFISTEKDTKDKNEYPIWIIDTVIQLKDIIEIPKNNGNITLGDVVNAIAKNKNVNANKRDIKNIIAKYHLPKLRNIQKTYNKNACFSDEHSRPKSSSMFLGVADMNESYFPFNENNKPIKISEEKDEELVNNSIITKMITRNANKVHGYYPIKLLKNDDTTDALKMYKKELKQLCCTLNSKLESAKKIKAEDIESNAQGFIIP